jgi:hypothetical protein
VTAAAGVSACATTATAAGAANVAASWWVSRQKQCTIRQTVSVTTTSTWAPVYRSSNTIINVRHVGGTCHLRCLLSGATFHMLQCGRREKVLMLHTLPRWWSVARQAGSEVSKEGCLLQS